MFSYRHAFHAGNHADVLKHMVLVQLLQHMRKKDKGFLAVDTHAGAAGYDLNGSFARKNSEFQSGIGQLFERTDPPKAVAEYLSQVRAINMPGRLVAYPGSSGIMHRLLRKQDRLRMFELHSTDSRLLVEHFKGAAPQALAQPADGFEGLRALLPPPSRRGMVLIDPPYEDKADYQRVIVALREAQQRFATGVYAVWYPLVRRRESRDFSARLRRLALADWLDVSLTVNAPPADGFGLYGSGVFVLNPPWTLAGSLAEAMPYLVRVLGRDAAAAFNLQSKIA